MGRAVANHYNEPYGATFASAIPVASYLRQRDQTLVIWIIVLAIVAAISLLALVLPKLGAVRAPAPGHTSEGHRPGVVPTQASTGGWGWGLGPRLSTRGAGPSSRLGRAPPRGTEKTEEFFARPPPA